MKCLSCSNLDLKKYPKHSETGFGRCVLGNIGSFVSINRERVCEKSAPAIKNTVQKRIEWYNKIQYV